MNARDRNINSANHDDRMIGRFEICEVQDVGPHRQPWEGDKDFNWVEVLLKNRMIPKEGEGSEGDKVLRQRVLCLQRNHGKFQGETWAPRIGDMVLLAWIYENTAYILGTVPSIEQEPVCRPNSTAKNPDMVIKWAKHKMPTKLGGFEDYVDFPLPEHPDCLKIWHQFQDHVLCLDCKQGHDTPSCKFCDHIDKILHSSNLKAFSFESDTTRDKPWRNRYTHHCGSTLWFDEDGLIHWENQVAEEARSHGNYFPDGTIELHSGPDDQKGARVLLYGDKSAYPGQVEIDNLVNAAHVKIYQNGKIELNRRNGFIIIEENGEIVLRGPKIRFEADVIETIGTTVGVSGSQVVNISGDEVNITANTGSCSLIPPPPEE